MLTGAQWPSHHHCYFGAMPGSGTHAPTMRLAECTSLSGKKWPVPQVLDNWSNFTAYGLQPPIGLVRADLHRHPFRAGLEEVRARLCNHGRAT